MCVQGGLCVKCCSILPVFREGFVLSVALSCIFRKGFVLRVALSCVCAREGFVSSVALSYLCSGRALC